MSNLWDKLISLSNDFHQLFDQNFTRYQPENFDYQFEGWKDYFWYSESVRKCHLKIIDNRQSRKLWLMHINIYPQTDTNLPILGYDIVAGPNKITGAFFDYSNCVYHPYQDYMELTTQSLQWNKPRQLPDWAKEIFSNNMIACGNIRTDDEVEQLCSVTRDLTSFYVENINDNSFKSSFGMTDWHNKYCYNQKLNDQLHKSIINMGISDRDKDRYVNEVLFQEI